MVLAVVLVAALLRRGNGNSNGTAISVREFGTLQGDVRTMSQLLQDVRREQSAYHSAGEKVGSIRYDQTLRSIEEVRNVVVDHQQAIERRLPAA